MSDGIVYCFSNNIFIEQGNILDIGILWDINFAIPKVDIVPQIIDHTEE